VPVGTADKSSPVAANGALTRRNAGDGAAVTAAHSPLLRFIARESRDLLEHSIRKALAGQNAAHRY